MEEVSFSLSRFREGGLDCEVLFKRYEGTADWGFGASGDSDPIMECTLLATQSKS